MMMWHLQGLPRSVIGVRHNMVHGSTLTGAGGGKKRREVTPTNNSFLNL